MSVWRRWRVRGTQWLQRAAITACAAIAVCAAVPVRAGQAPDAAAAGGEGRVWRYGMLANYPPFQVWPDGGWPGGADLEMLSDAAARAGGRIEPQRYTDFRALLDDLAAGRIDVASAMARTPDRERRLAFGPTYAHVEQVLVTRSRDGDVPLSPDLAGRRVAVVEGYASAGAVARLFPLAPRVTVKDVPDGLRALGEGRADLFIESARVVAETLDRLQLPDLRMARTVILDSGDLHLATGTAAAGQLAPLAAALDAMGSADRQARIVRWSAVELAPAPVALALSADEQARLAAMPPLRVAVLAGQAPFSSVDVDGVPVGLSVDVLSAMLTRLGLPAPTWRVLGANEALLALRDGEVDLALGLPELAARRWGIGFAGPFIEHPLMLVASRRSGLWSMEQMAERRLAMPTLQVPQTLLQTRYPRVVPAACPSVADCLTLVRRGQAQAAVADVVSVALVLGGGTFDDLQFVGTAGDLRHARGVAVSPVQRPLVPLLQRALDTVMVQDLPAIKQQWLERPPPRRVVWTFVRQAAPWALAALAALGLLWWWHERGLRVEMARTRAARRDAEQAAASSQRFIVFLAHEVRNSLHSVIAAGELLRGQPGVGADVVEPMKRSARGTLALLNGLLDRERLAAGALTLNPGPVRLPAMVAAVIDEMVPMAQAAGATLVLDPLPDCLLRVDALRVQQVLRNLLSNAIKYGGPGQVTVSHTIEAEDGECRLCLSVRDQGPGLDSQSRSRAFEPYAAAVPGRLDSAGLGLALSRDLARALGGDLTLSTVEGGGLEARFSWRAACLDTRPDTRAAAGATEPSERRVLVVEDAEVYALLLRRAFEGAGWQVVSASDVATARAQLAAQPFALLLVDLHLPDGDASAVLEAATRPGLCRIVMSADLDARVPPPRGADHAVAKDADAALFVSRVLLLERETAVA